MTSLRSFTKFPKLPSELRIKIWKLVPSPRVVILKGTYLEDGEKNICTSPTPPPAMLHVCRESREVALGIYTADSFTSHLPPAQVIYINFATDVVFLHDLIRYPLTSILPINIDKRTASKITSLAIREPALLGYIPRVLPGLMDMAHLAHLYWVTAEGSKKDWDNISLCQSEMERLCFAGLASSRPTTSQIMDRFERFDVCKHLKQLLQDQSIVLPNRNIPSVHLLTDSDLQSIRERS